ncbi:polyprenyl synthetase family protein [Candidatus Margulisiibacteriota bacterium]
MNFVELSNKYIPIIEKELTNQINFNLPDKRKILKEAMAYALLAKGKRVRPLLTIAATLLFGNEIKKIMPIACAVEMIHTYSLIHDDLPSMDNDDFRRGQPTCHKKFGEDIAILAGDTLNTLAFEAICTCLPKYYKADKIIKVISLLAAACGINGMAGGQIMDIKGDAGIKDAKYLKDMHALKTGALIKACIIIPAILEDANEDILFNLTNFSYHLGLLFQIVDDILDSTGNKAKLGKSPNKDKEQNKLTYTGLFGIKGAKEMAQKEADKARSYLVRIKPLDIKMLLAIIDFFEKRDF